VLATDVLEHVDDDRAVKEMFRVLSAGGTVVATVPAFMSLWHGNDDHSHHLRRYRRDEFRDLFVRNGFNVAYMNYWNRLFFVPVWLTARMYKRDAGELRNNLSTIPRWMNPILTGWMYVENAVCRYVPLPFGVSLVVVAKKHVS
jgi:hypothetical protein